MSQNFDSNHGPDRSNVYQIRIKAHLGSRWSARFAGMTISPEENGDTLVTGPVADQAALHGLLKQVRDLGLPLLSVTRAEPDQSDSASDSQSTRHSNQED